MSAKITGMVFDRYPAGGGEMLLALALADHAHDDGTSIFPSIARLAQKTRQSQRSVQYQLRSMEESGWLILVSGAKGGRKPGAEAKGRTREYRINPAWVKGAEIAPFEDGAEGEAKGANSAPLEPVKGATDDSKGCNPRQERVQSTTSKGATAIAPESSVNRNEPSVNCGAGAPAGHILNSTTGQPNTRPVQIAILLRKTYGMTDATSNSAAVIEMDRMGVTDLEIAEHVDIFRLRKPDEKPNAGYLHRMIASTRQRSAKAPQQGGGQSGFVRAADDWWTSASGIERVGLESGVKWQKARGEAFADFKVRVLKAAGEGPWRDAYFADLLRKQSTRYAGDHEYVYGHPPMDLGV
ncbi:helix-turn-helix domain-containing protein [Cupriavidus sp. KB_39]|uniref:helix-turn-helix domain-containing protein n=1 Tax=Cupriavidus sp. KB_39 TaxID=3233036 RepID=UPI003F8DA61D